MMAIAVAVAGLTACSSDDALSPGFTPSGYPRNVSIEYKVLSNDATTGTIHYHNETGAMSTVDDAALPFSKTVKRSVNYADSLFLSVSTSAAGEVTTEIWVDGNLVDSKVHQSTSNVGGYTGYSFL